MTEPWFDGGSICSACFYASAVQRDEISLPLNVAIRSVWQETPAK